MKNTWSFCKATMQIKAFFLPAIVAISLVLALPSARASESPPERMTYQGFLVDANGQALGFDSPENYTIVFSIFSAQTGGDPLWSEQQTVTVDKGYFSVLLGEGANAGDGLNGDLSPHFQGSDASERYIAIKVKGIAADGGDLEILPRLRLVTSPYAFLATQVVGNSIASSEVADNSLTAADLGADSVGTSEVEDNSLTALDLAANSVGSSELAANSVGSSEVEDNSLTAADLAANSVGGSEIAANAVGTSEVADNSLTAADLAANSVGSSELGANSVGTSEIADGSILNADIAANARIDPTKLAIAFGSIKFYNGVHSIDAGSHNLIINSNNQDYHVLFDPPFASTPAVTGSVIRDDKKRFVTFDFIDRLGFRYSVWDSGGGYEKDSNPGRVHIIAIGK